MIADLAAPAPLAGAIAVLAPALGVASRLVIRPRPSVARWIGIVATTAVLAASIALAWAAPYADAALRLDRLAALIAMLVAAAAATSAWSGGTARLRELACLAGLMLALLADSATATWLGVHAAVTATAGPGWTAKLPAMIGSAIALGGTLLLALATSPAPDAWAEALRWSTLARDASASNGALLAVAAALLLIGYGMAVLQAPPATMQAASVLVVVLATLLRLRALLALNPDSAVIARPLLIAAGLATIAIAAAALWTRSADQRIRIGYAAAGQAGVALTTFGLGGAEAIAAGLLHLTMLTLIVVATMRSAGRAGVVSVAALALLPPSGLFASAATILAVTARAAPWLVLPLAAGLATLAAPLIMRRVHDAPETARPSAASVPAWLALALATLLGFAMPASIAGWLQATAASLP